MKLHLPSLLRTAVLACAACGSTLYAADYIAEGVNISQIVDRYDEYNYYVSKEVQLNLDTSTRFYDGGKGRDWDNFEAAAYQVYAQNGYNLNVFGDLADSITKPEYKNELDTSKLTNDSGHCWAYTSSNMLQYWQTYYGVFAKKAGDPTTSAPVHGLNYDSAYMETLGGTQSLKLNKLFYDGFEGTAGGNALKAFSWYLYGEPGLSGAVDTTSAPGYFKQYFNANNETHTTVNALNLSSLEAMSDSIKQAFGYTQQNGEWVQTTKGQIMYLELSKSGGSHAITCYGFETDDNGNIKALYVVNSDDAQFELVKVYTKFVSEGTSNKLSLHYDEECYGFLTYGDWRVTGWSTINTPEVLKTMLAEYESGALTWMGNLGSWTNTPAVAADVNVLPTDATGWMTYAGTGTEHAGYYNSYYSTGRGVEFNDTASSTTVAVAEHIAVASMAVNNSEKDYSFNGGETTKVITISGDFTKTGTGALEFSGVKLVANSASVEGDVSFDQLQLSGNLYTKGNTVTLKGDSSFNNIDSTHGENSLGSTSLIIAGGTTQITDAEWVNLNNLTLAEDARLEVTKGSVYVAGNISATEGGAGTQATGGIASNYCIKVGTAGDSTTGHVNLKGDMSSGAYVHIMGNLDMTGNLTQTGENAKDGHRVEIGGNASIGGDLTTAQKLTIGGNAKLGGNATISGSATIGGKLELTAGKSFSATSLSVGGDLTGGAGTSVTTTGSMTLGGNVSSVALKANSITMGAADGAELKLDSVEMELTGGNVTLTKVRVTGDCSFSTTSDAPLTVTVNDVTFVLDGSNSSLSSAKTRMMTLGTGTESSNPLTISSDILAGLNIEGTMTLDLTGWADVISTGNYDSLVLTFAEANDLSSTAEVELLLEQGSETVTAVLSGTNSYVVNFSPQTGQAIPEPTTASLSLLAMAGLLARRRRS